MMRMLMIFGSNRDAEHWITTQVFVAPGAVVKNSAALGRSITLGDTHIRVVAVHDHHSAQNALCGYEYSAVIIDESFYLKAPPKVREEVLLMAPTRARQRLP